MESLHLLRGVSGYLSVEPEEPAGLTQLEVARGSPPRSFAAVIFPGKKVFGLSVGTEFLRLNVYHLRRFGVLEICIVFLSSAHHCTFSTSHFGRELIPPGLSPVHPPTASSDFNRSFLPTECWSLRIVMKKLRGGSFVALSISQPWGN